jgi:hypothetical protein
MPIKIWYESLPKLPKILWPIVELKLHYKRFSVPQRIHALVDSGANRSVLHPLIAEAIGFNRRKLGKPKIGGFSASGDYKSWILPELVEVDIYGYILSVRFVVIDNPKLIWPCILGGDSIFEMARIDFQKFKGYFEVRFRTDIN